MYSSFRLPSSVPGRTEIRHAHIPLIVMLLPSGGVRPRISPVVIERHNQGDENQRCRGSKDALPKRCAWGQVLLGEVANVLGVIGIPSRAGHKARFRCKKAQPTTTETRVEVRARSSPSELHVGTAAVTDAHLWWWIPKCMLFLATNC